MTEAHEIVASAPVLVELRRPDRRPVIVDLVSYQGLSAKDLAGTRATLLVRCVCGTRVRLVGPLDTLVHRAATPTLDEEAYCTGCLDWASGTEPCPDCLVPLCAAHRDRLAHGCAGLRGSHT